MTGQRIMVIGGRWSPEPLVSAAKDLGCWVLATHYSGRLTAIPHADETKELHPRDTAYAIQLARAHDIEAVVADSDDNSLYAAGVLASQLGLAGPNMTAVLASTNKKILRTTCRERGIQQPEFCVGSSLHDLREGVRQLGGFPLVIKPVDNQGGVGVTKLEGKDDIEEAFRRALAGSPSKEWILEQFIDGAVVNVAGLSPSPDEHLILTTASKRIMPCRTPLTVKLVYPAEIEKTSLDEAVALHKKAVEALDYDFGLAHSEIAIDATGKAWLIEATNRGEAWFLSTLVLPALTGLKINHHLVRMAAGEVLPEIESGIPPKKSVIVASLRLKEEERMKKIAKLGEVMAMPGILRCEIIFQEGDVIPKEDPRIGYLIAAAETPDTAHALVQDARRILEVESW